MKRSFILQEIATTLGNSNLRGPIGEIRISALTKSGKSRSIFLAECPTDAIDAHLETIRTYLDGNYPEQYLCTHAHFASPEAMLAADIPGMDRSAVENNWRCRLMRPEQLLIGTPALVKENALDSIWRTFVIRDPVNYFVRHDIFPAIWYSGYSVPGFPDFRSGLHSALSTISHQNGILVDVNFDVVKLFVKSAEGNSHVQLGAAVPILDLLRDFDRTYRGFEDLAMRYFGQEALPRVVVRDPAPAPVVQVGGVPHALQNNAGVQMTRAACPGDPRDYFYNPVTNSWTRKRD
jgi:hypothetical protein